MPGGIIWLGRDSVLYGTMLLSTNAYLPRFMDKAYLVVFGGIWLVAWFLMYWYLMDGARYNIMQAPQHPRWVRDRSCTDTTKLYYNNRLLRFWIVGEVPEGGNALISEQGHTRPLVALSVMPIRVGELYKWNEYLQTIADVAGKCLIVYDDRGLNDA